MYKISDIKKAIRGSRLDEYFETLYGRSEKAVSLQKGRYLDAIDAFEELYPGKDMVSVFSTPGRTEICGNHTDHNMGKVLAASVDLDVIAIAAPNGSDIIRLRSKGFEPDLVDIKVTKPLVEERFCSAALIRGVCSRIGHMGYQVGGFDAYTTSNVLKGSGLSSSAAFEVLAAFIVNNFFCDGVLDPVTIAKIARYAENEFFGKPCGLMDQLACAVGGFTAIDFGDPQEPVVEKIDFDFVHSGHSLVIVNTGGCHADLNEDYAALPREMKSVAKALGTQVLRDSTLEELLEEIPKLRDMGNDRAILRAFHFYHENKRVGAQINALKTDDFESFLRNTRKSGDSSWKLCQNCYSCSDPMEQGIPLALTISEAILDGRGASRVHGGGFAGTIQAFVPDGIKKSYIAEMERIFGTGSCHDLMIRPCGSIKLCL
jgi:galactokinase